MIVQCNWVANNSISVFRLKHALPPPPSHFHSTSSLEFIRLDSSRVALISRGSSIHCQYNLLHTCSPRQKASSKPHASPLACRWKDMYVFTNRLTSFNL